MQKDGGSDLRISWESVSSDGSRLHRGHLGALFVNQAYDHRVFVETTAAVTTVDEGNHDWYFLVSSDCRASDSGVGRDSGGVERPHGGLISLRIGVQGGAGVFAVQTSLFFPEGEAFPDDDSASFLGPFTPGSPGGPLNLANPNLPGEVRSISTFTQTMPDPSFDPPAMMPLDIEELLFGYHGVPPLAGRFSIGDCRVKDIDALDIPATSCVVAGFDVLF